MKVIVTGGAGYIGAHVARALAERGPRSRDPRRPALRSAADAPVGLPLERAALEDTAAVTRGLRPPRPDAVVHLAGYISVGESVRDPDKYWGNNLGAGASLLIACARVGVEDVPLLVDRRGLRQRRRLADPRGGAPGADLALRRLEARLRAPAPRGRAGPRLPLGGAALLQRRRRPPRVAGRRGARPRGAPDPARHARGARRPPGAGLRQRLPDARRHLRPRLHPRHRPRQRPRPGAGSDALPSGSSFNCGTGNGHSVLEVIQAVGRRLGRGPVIERGRGGPAIRPPSWPTRRPSSRRVELAPRHSASTRSSTRPCLGALPPLA